MAAQEAKYQYIKPLLGLLLSFFTYNLETKAYYNFMRIKPNGLNLINIWLNNFHHTQSVLTQYHEPTQ